METAGENRASTNATISWPSESKLDDMQSAATPPPETTAKKNTDVEETTTSVEPATTRNVGSGSHSPDAFVKNNDGNHSSQPQSPRTPLLDDMSNTFVMKAAARKLSRDCDRHVNADDNDQQNFRSSGTGEDAVDSSTQRQNSGGSNFARQYSGRLRENSGNQTPLRDSNNFFASAALRRYSNDFDRHVIANDNNQKTFTNAYPPSEVRETETRRRLSMSDTGNGGGGDVDQHYQGASGRTRYVQQLSKKSEVDSDYERSTAGQTSTDGSDHDERMRNQKRRPNNNSESAYFYQNGQRQNDDTNYGKLSRRQHSSPSGSNSNKRSRELEDGVVATGDNRGGLGRNTSWFGNKPLQDQNLEELIFTALRVLLLLACLVISLKLVGAIGRYAWPSYHHPPTISRLQRGIQVEKGEYCRSFDKHIPNYGFPVAMEEMLQDARWHDVIVVAKDGTQKKAHKVVLAARSPVLRAELEALTKQTDEDGRIRCSTDKPCKLQLEQVDGDILPSFVEFLYTSRTDDRKHAAELLALGHAFQVPDLKDAAAEDLMLNMSDADSIHGLVVGHDYEHSALRNYSMEYIRENWKHVRESAAWKHAVENRPSLIIDALMYVITESKCRF